MQVYVPSAHAESALLEQGAKDGVFKSCCRGQKSAATSSGAALEGAAPTRQVEPVEGPPSGGEEVRGYPLLESEDVCVCVCVCVAIMCDC